MSTQNISKLEKTFQEWALSKVTCRTLLDQLELRLRSQHMLPTELADLSRLDLGLKARLRELQLARELV